jgi:ABC-type antimicrobial peptide transport system permease subunit
MKTKYFILAFFAIVLVLCSCVIREPEDKEVLTRPGRLLYNQIEPTLIEQIQLFDKILFVDTYQNTPDSLKTHYLFDNFGQYGFTVRGTDCFFKMDNDTSCVITTDSKSIHSVGAMWLVKGQSLPYYLTIRNISRNKWRLNIHPTNSYYSVHPVSESLEIECTDTVAPKRFKDSDFSVSGNMELADNSYSDGARTLTAVIISPLQYIRVNNFFSAGGVKITAANRVQNKKAETVAEYINDDSPKMKITFEGITSVYTNYQWLVY